jgi:hypothetical protein
MLRVLAAAVAVMLAAPAGAASGTAFAFGRVGGNIIPFSVTIGRDGTVRAKGSVTVGRPKLSPAALSSLSRVATANGFRSLPAVTNCAGTLPDAAATYVRVGGRTVRVHGACLARYNRVWTALTLAVDLRH